MMTSCNMNTWSVVLVIWYCCLVAVVHSRLLPFHHSNHAMSSSSHLSNEKATISTEKIPTSHKSNLIDKTKLRRYLSIRGGSTMSADSSSSSGAVAASTSTVVVSTSLGSLFLDKKKKLTLPSNSTIGQLKEQLQVKFPGSPPSSLQRLFFGNRLLANHEVLNNLTTLPVVPLLLDMITGTSAYNKTLSVTQGIDAYVSSVVQLAYLGDMLTNALTSANPALTTSNPSESGLNDDENNIITTQQVMKTIYYRQLYEIVNASIYDMYAEDIAMALEDEKNPETFAEDTKAWRGKDKKAKSPLVIAMAKEFDLNIRGLKNFVYFSIVLVIFAYMGSPTPQNTAIMLTMIPFMWISKLRHLRILSKIGLHLTLQSLPTLDFLLPLFSAPYQVMAHEHTKWFEDEEDMSLEELEAKMMKDEDGADENQADEEADEEENEEEGDEEAEEEEGADEEEANEEEGEDEEDEE